MRTRVLVVGVAFAAAGMITACERTTPGTVAMTTEPGFSISTTSRPTTSSPRSTTPRSTTPNSTTPRSTTPRTPGSGPRSDALSMACQEYVDLDPAEQESVIDEIINQSDSVFDPSQRDIAKIFVDGTCTFLPEAVVSELLLGGPPP
ncbi:MAG: hypothetical protein ABW137_30405 [Mycobacterium sp.]